MECYRSLGKAPPGRVTETPGLFCPIKVFPLIASCAFTSSTPLPIAHLGCKLKSLRGHLVNDSAGVIFDNLCLKTNGRR